MSHYPLPRNHAHTIIRFAILGIVAVLLIAFLIRTAAIWL